MYLGFLVPLFVFSIERFSSRFIKSTAKQIRGWLTKRENDYILDKYSHIDTSVLTNKKLISIAPGGILGFYLLGTCTYIKENYKLDDYVFTGASAGAWNAFFMTYKNDPNEFALRLLTDDDLSKVKTIHELEYVIKYKLLKTYTENDFDTSKLFIGVTTLRKFLPRVKVFSNFENIEDAINCCIGSSHIPFITGGLLNRFHDILTFDGGFSHYPYLNTQPPVLHITASMWKKDDKYSYFDLCDYITSFKNGSVTFIELFDEGYKDAKKNKETLDTLFETK